MVRRIPLFGFKIIKTRAHVDPTPGSGRFESLCSQQSTTDSSTNVTNKLTPIRITTDKVYDATRRKSITLVDQEDSVKDVDRTDHSGPNKKKKGKSFTLELSEYDASR